MARRARAGTALRPRCPARHAQRRFHDRRTDLGIHRARRSGGVDVGHFWSSEQVNPSRPRVCAERSPRAPPDRRAPAFIGRGGAQRKSVVRAGMPDAGQNQRGFQPNSSAMRARASATAAAKPSSARSQSCGLERRRSAASRASAPRLATRPAPIARAEPRNLCATSARRRRAGPSTDSSVSRIPTGDRTARAVPLRAPCRRRFAASDERGLSPARRVFGGRSCAKCMATSGFSASGGAFHRIRWRILRPARFDRAPPFKYGDPNVNDVLKMRDRRCFHTRRRAVDCMLVNSLYAMRREPGRGEWERSRAVATVRTR